MIAVSGKSAQHTGANDSPWAGGRAGANYVTQGNLLVGPEVVEAVAASFEASEGTPRHLADRLIDAIAAGHAKGGDARKGRTQSAAVIVADARPGRSRRADGVTVNINVCEHPEPVAELRRVYNTISQTLGYRQLEQFTGNDVWQLKVMLNALGLFRPNEKELRRDVPDALVYTPEAVASVDAFRAGRAPVGAGVRLAAGPGGRRHRGAPVGGAHAGGEGGLGPAGAARDRRRPAVDGTDCSGLGTRDSATRPGGYQRRGAPRR